MDQFVASIVAFVFAPPCRNKFLNQLPLVHDGFLLHFRLQNAEQTFDGIFAWAVTQP